MNSATTAEVFPSADDQPEDNKEQGVLQEEPARQKSDPQTGDKQEGKIPDVPLDAEKSPELPDAKKCCKCTQGNCMKCKCYKDGRFCQATCTAAACANRPFSKNMTVETEDALLGPKAKSETEELAKELGALSKQVRELGKTDLDVKHIIAELQFNRRALKELREKATRIETRLDELERKLDWQRNSGPESTMERVREPELRPKAGRGSFRRASEEDKNNTIQEFFEGTLLTTRTTDTEESAFSMGAAR